MKLALISDIHANLPALLAVLKDIERHQPGDIYCLGDLVNFAGWDNEVIELLRKLDITCICGNHDEGIARCRGDFSFSYADEDQRQFGLMSIGLVNERITEENRSYLSNLPFMIQLEFRFPFHRVRLAMVHGSVSGNQEYIYEDVDEEYLLDMMAVIDADILLMGHTHKPFHKSMFTEKENRKLYAHAINVGSVGKPKQGDPMACYAILNLNHEADLASPDAVSVHFVYVPYDTEQVIKKIEDDGLSHAYDEFLRKGQL